MKRKLGAFALVVAMLLAALPVLAIAEPLPMRWILPGTAKFDVDMVEDALHEALLADGLNIKPDFIYYNWDVWEQKTNVMFAAGDEFEMIHTMDNGSPSTATLLSKNAIIPLNDLLNEYGQTMLELFPDAVWEQATHDGQIMAIPAPWIDMGVENYFAMRQDMLDKYGLELPNTLDELYDVCVAIQQGELAETGLNWYLSIRAQGNVGLYTPLQRGIDGYPFENIEMMGIIYEDGTVASYLESDQFKQWCDFTYRMNQAGLVYPDLLSMDTGSYNEPTERGNFVASDRNFSSEHTLRQYDPNVSLVNLYLNKEVDKYRFTAYPNCNTVSATSPHPEVAVQFMNWLYSSQDHMDLLTLGIEGVHWNSEGERTYSLTDYNIDGTTLQSQYSFGNWMTGWAPYQRFNIDSNWELSAELEYTFSEDTKTFISSGFVFSPSNVAAEYANCQAVITTYINPILLGFQTYEESMPAALQRMKDAGLDKVVEEIQTQFAAFLASKGE